MGKSVDSSDLILAQAPPEPNPDWRNSTAQETLGWLWPGHVYLFAVLFLILGLITTLALILALKPRSRQNKLFHVRTTMLCAIIVLSVSRSLVLFVDPYSSNDITTSIWWNFGHVLVTGLGTTSLTASLAILLYIITVSTRITPRHRQVELGRVVCGITIGNFAFFITSDVITMLFMKGKIMLTICQITFAIWGIVVSTGFGVLTYKLRQNARATFEQARCNISMDKDARKLGKLSVLLAVVSATGAVFFVLRICEAISGLTTSAKYSDTWAWWSMQTGLRLLEIVNAIVLLLVFKKEVNKDEERKRRQNTGSGHSGSERQTWWKDTSVKSNTGSV